MSTPTEDRDDPTPPASKRRALWLVGGIVAAAIVAFLAFGVFGVQTLFIDDEVSEEGPEFASGAAAAPEVTAAPPTTRADGGDDPVATQPPATTTPAQPVVEVAATGTFTAVDHPGSGTVNLLTDGTQTFVRFEDDFSTDNGPDLFAVVYVDGQLIELDRLKGNVGSQNYELPSDIDPTAVETVAVWCKRFSSTFTEATLG